MGSKLGPCEQCRFWEGPPTGLPNRWGECRRASPVLTPFTQTGMWPLTKYDSWCGDFELQGLSKAIDVAAEEDDGLQV